MFFVLSSLKLPPPHHSDSIAAIAIDANGTIYFSTANILWKTTDRKTTEFVLNFPSKLKGMRADVCGMVYLDNNLYLISRARDTVFRYDILSGNLSVLAGKEDHKDGYLIFSSPWKIAVDKDGNLIVSDTCVRKINLQAETDHHLAYSSRCPKPSNLKSAETSQNELQFPGGVALGSDGTVFVCDVFTNCIKKIKDSRISNLLVPKTVSDIAFSNGFLFAGHDQLLIIHETGQSMSVVAGVTNILALTTDKHGIVYAASKGVLFQLQPLWSVERLLWIGNLKEESACHFARLPKEIIKEIISYLGHAREVNLVEGKD